jgi:hypothetical protein
MDGLLCPVVIGHGEELSALVDGLEQSVAACWY